MKEAIIYTATDIERYHSGALSPTEMHAIEKAALDDPFLADAIEGYAFTKTAASDLSLLHQKLEQRIKKNDRKSLLSIGSAWMKIAALFIVVAGGAWLIFRTSPVADKQDVATLNKPQTPPELLRQNSVADSDSAFPLSPATETLASDKKPANEPVVINNTTAKELLYKSPSVPVEQDAATGRGDLNPSAFYKKDSSVARLSTTNQTNDFFKLHVDSSSKSTALNEVTVRVQKQKTDTIRNFNVVLKNIEVPADEVVVVNSKARANAPRSQLMKMTVDTLEPENGWNNYDDYIANNLKSPDQLKSKPIAGSVELSFDVNRDGEPVNVTVTKSLCSQCDEEAIRLLKEGPKWKRKTKKAKLKIKF